MNQLTHRFLAATGCFGGTLSRLAALAVIPLALSAGASEALLPYVRPLVGTAKPGQTVPAVGVPFGMTQLTPETRRIERHGLAPYYYGDTNVSGFRVSHWVNGSAMQDYGSVTIMPMTGKLTAKPSEYSLPIAHESEVAAPDYYQLKLAPYGLTVELTALARSGMIRVTADKPDTLYLLITPNNSRGKGFVEVDPAHHEITGYNPAYRIYQGSGLPAGISGYFVIQTERGFETNLTFSGETMVAQTTPSEQTNLAAFIGFKVAKGEKLTLRIGTSFTSIDEARKNLQAEIPGWKFDQVRHQSAQAWEKALNKIQITTSDAALKRVFYTSFYHSLLHPRLFSDADGTYPKFAQQYQLAKLSSGNYYDDFSMWDIYRAELPLFEILEPELVGNWIQSMVLKGQQAGWLPIFPCWNNYTSEMIGDHVTALIVSAYQRGIRNYDLKEAYRLMRHNAFDTPTSQEDYKDGKGRRALTSYLKYGFIPMEDAVPDAFHRKEQVSRTMEYAYDDYALSVMAKALGEQSDYEALSGRARNYRNVFDSASGFVRGKNADSTWATNFGPDNMKLPYITEGSPRQYTFYVPQDVPDLAKLMGGTQALERALDEVFTKNRYWHGNEPGHQIPFMYNYTQAPWKTQRQVRQLLAEEYHDGPGGLKGNDDAGQMSAWYIFGATGFYPLDPVSGDYLLCSPLFDKTVIHLTGDKKFTITTHKATPHSIYIASIKLNGQAYTKNYLSHADLSQGGTLEVFLQEQPGDWGTKAADQPKPGLITESRL